jgi:transposase
MEVGVNKRYVVRLTAEERGQLEALVKWGKGHAYRIKHANILLAVDANGPAWPDEKVSEAFRCHVGTVANVRQRLVEGGLERALERKPQAEPSRQRSLDGRGEARLIALACSQAPDGRSRWTLKLLADKLVELEVVEAISDQTVRRALKKTSCSLTGANVG